MRATYDDVARRQLGLLRTSQLTDLGWTIGEIRSALDKEQLFAIRPGVYRCAGTELTQAVAWRAAQLAAGEDHVLSHLTAAKIWHLKDYPEPDRIHLLTASGSRTRIAGVRGHETESLPDDDTTIRRSLPVTTPARTLLDTCGAVSFHTYRSAVNDALRRTPMRALDFVRCVDRAPASGRRKIWPARLVVASLVPGYDPGDSEPEIDLVQTIEAAGYPRPEQQIWVRGRGWKYRIDVGYRDVKHGFEYQSEQEHLNRESFHNDPLRTVRLQRAGWTMWPITARTGRGEIILIVSTIFRR